mgnify:CR=1 FL=1
MIRKKVPDKAKALSILNAAANNIEAIKLLEGNRKADGLAVTAIYESFRMLGDALLTAEGFETSGKDHHAEMIGRLLKLQINADRSLLVLDELRRKRNKVNYEGYAPSEDEVKDIIAVKNSLWDPVFNEVKGRIEK